MRMIASFEKTPRVRHLGHLDLLRSMQRALRRSGLPVRYSQGFNPHIVLSFASALSVGVSGAEELMDAALEAEVTEEAFRDALAPALPDSLPLRGVRAVDDRHPALAALLTNAAYEAVLAESEEARALAGAIPALLAREEIIALRRTKSGEKPCDIRPMIYELDAVEADGAWTLRFRTALTERQTLRPDLLLRTLASEAGLTDPPPALLRRMRLYGERSGEAAPLMTL